LKTRFKSTVEQVSKPDGGVRRITVGEAGHRLAMLCAAISVAEIGRALAPLQLGAGVSGGAKAVTHAVRNPLAADLLAVVIKVDVENAFNSLTHGTRFAAVRKRAPELLPVVT
jgi:hypothetical protein